MNESNPPNRSGQLAFAQAMPNKPIANNRIGRPPVGVAISRRTSAKFRVGTSAISQSTIKMLVAVFDQGNAVAAPIAKASALRASRIVTTDRPFEDNMLIY